MKTIQVTIDAPLLDEVDRLASSLGTTRSAFIREALQAAIRRHAVDALEKQHRRGYALHPAEPGEVGAWLTEQAWGDE